MRLPLGRWSLTSLPLLFFVLAAWALESVLGVDGNVRWILRVGFWALGLVSAFVLNRFLKGRAENGSPKGTPKGRSREDEVDEAVATAESRLAKSAATPSGRLRKLPLVLLLGPRGSTKTSIVTHSGVEAELVAGTVWKGEQVAPTDGVNFWYGEGAVLAESGGAVLDDPDRWERLLHHLRPQRMGAVLGTGDQPHRAAVLCFGCDEFVKPGASESVPAAARKLRERLQELAERLGVGLPVYVVFTKADRIPYFEDYARNLTRAETEDVVGATIPLSRWSEAGAYGETASRVVDEAFEEIFRSLATGRSSQLGREGDPEGKRGIFEFPREVRKISETATRFLVELCRPSHLQVSPILRGFYFAGVRPVVVDEGHGEPSVRSSSEEPDAMGATMVFDPSDMDESPPAPAPSSSTRRVPEWTFLRRLFRDIVLGDAVAASSTGKGAAVNLLRRALLGSVVAGLLVLIFGMTVSTVSNRRHTARVQSALEEVEPLARAEAADPGLEQLRTMDALAGEVATFREWESDGAPLGSRWGLYRGDELLDAARQVYLPLVERLLAQEARQALARHLEELPQTPTETSEYGATYDALKAYLVLTSYPENSSGEFLAPVLMEHWSPGRGLQQEALQLARRQFEIYGEELRHGRVRAVSGSPELVERSRDFLEQFASVERYYRSMIAGASASTPGVRLAERYPSARGVLRSDVVVPGAFTLEGWTFIQDNLDDVEQLFSQEEWVTGGQTFTEADLERLAGELRSRYVADYQRHWQRFLASASVVPFQGPADAARKLQTLSDNRSPLLQLLTLVDRNTRVGAPDVEAAFAPVRAVTPPDSVDRYVWEANRPYVDALANLQASVEQLQGSGGQGGATRIAGDADQLRSAVREIAREFPIEGGAERVGVSVRGLLESPADLAQRLAAALPSRAVNSQGAAFCQRFRSLTSGYPFDLRSSSGVEIGDLDAALKPGESALWSFHEGTLRRLLSRQGSGFGPRVDARPEPGPVFLRFFNRAVTISEALYESDGSGPAVDFILRLEASGQVPEVTASIDGQTQTFSRTRAAGEPFRWEGGRARTARISGQIAGEETVLVEGREGPWALFRLLGKARWEDRGNSQYRLTWPVQGRQIDLQGQLILSGGVPILNPEFLADLNCVPTVTR